MPATPQITNANFQPETNLVVVLKIKETKHFTRVAPTKGCTDGSWQECQSEKYTTRYRIRQVWDTSVIYLLKDYCPVNCTGSPQGHLRAFH